jgi:hypothetical protein
MLNALRLVEGFRRGCSRAKRPAFIFWKKTCSRKAGLLDGLKRADRARPALFNDPLALSSGGTPGRAPDGEAAAKDSNLSPAAR